MTLATIPSYDPGRLDPVEGHAVVLGGSMAGMLVARVLADRYESVTVVDRDPLPDDDVARRGVPQSMQPHGLLEGGRATIESLFPGFCDAVVQAGGVRVDVDAEVQTFVGGTPKATRETDSPPMYCATRSRFDQVVRRFLRRTDGVTLRDECRFLDYLTDDEATSVIGVRLRDESGDEMELSADLVVDATGRVSRTPAWLESNGYERPPLDEVKIDLVYGTVLVERPPDDRRTMLVPAVHPSTRGSVVVPVEDGRWVMSLHGFHGDHPPTDATAFERFAAGLPTAAVAELLAEHSLVDETVYRYPIPASRRYHYEALDRFPEGLLVVGDALASFNPIYAQGMTVAALESLWLHNVLAAGDERLSTRFFERAATVVDLAWGMSVGPDFAFPETEGPEPGQNRLVSRYVSRLNRHARHDPYLTHAFGRVVQFERPPSSLFRPSVVWRVVTPKFVRNTVRRAVSPNTAGSAVTPSSKSED